MLTLPDVQPPKTSELTSRLGSTWAVAVASSPLDVGDLTPGERRRYDSLPVHGERRSEWLTGRAALREVLAQMQWDVDTAKLTMPHDRFALSHCGGTAVAVGWLPAGAAGVGIDVEVLRSTPPDIARFFLRRSEIGAVAEPDQHVSDVDTLRLWTVKEAVFKADRGNRGGQLYDYVLDDSPSWAGSATKAGHPNVRFRYRTVQTGEHLVSVARRTDEQR